MKIIFVGIHNKPGKMPFDSTTRTGNVISKIINHLLPYACQKTNLFDCDTMPLESEVSDHIKEYFDRIDYKKGDVFVLLGQYVHKHFPTWISGVKIIKLPHPSSVIRRAGQTEYIASAINKIKNSIEAH